MSAESGLKLKRNTIEFMLQAGSEIESINLHNLFENPKNLPLKFSAELVLGGPLPANLVCSDQGIISGTLEKNTATFLPYAVLIIAQSDGYDPLTFEIYLHVAPVEGDEASEAKEPSELDFNLEQFETYWQSFADKLELPDLEELLTRRVTRKDIYYFISKFSNLTVWNSDDFRPAEDGKIITIPGASDQFMVYDFDVALVASPKDLYSPSRTLMDVVETAKAMVKEAHRRKWNIELAGFDKMVSAAWVEAEWINKANPDGKIEVKNFIPTSDDWAHLSNRIKMVK